VLHDDVADVQRVGIEQRFRHASIGKAKRARDPMEAEDGAASDAELIGRQG